MDPITHLTAGALGGQAFRRPLRNDRYWLAFCIFAAWLPDSDNFVGLLGTEFYLLYHRGVTHSFLGGLFLAAVFVAIFRLFVNKISFVRGLLIAYALILVHIFLDLITSYGTQIFFPFTNARYAVTSIFIIDPIYTLTMLFILYRTFRTQHARNTLAIAGIIWIFLYPTMSLGIRCGLHAHVEHRLKREGVAFTRMDVSTDVFSPFFWKVILEQEDSYQIGGITLFKPNDPITLKRFQKADDAVFHDFSKTAPIFKTYAWFFDFPIMHTEAAEHGEEIVVTIWDLRFASTLDFMQRMMNDNGQQPFALRAVLNEQHELVRYYDHRGEETVVNYLH